MGIYNYTARDVIIFGVNNSSLRDAENDKNSILELG